MIRVHTSGFFALIAMTAGALAMAQSTTPSNDTTPPNDTSSSSTSSSTSPSAASSPHQRSMTSSQDQEAATTNNDGTSPSSAASPHQQQATTTHTGMSGTHSQMMKDCMAREQAKNSGASKQEMKKTCKSELKTASSSSSNSTR